uniref:Putative secreted protein n=1 Tax=Ixodes ricinus TaxID=34613 RepID=A0A6B0UPT2_IXORI
MTFFPYVVMHSYVQFTMAFRTAVTFTVTLKGSPMNTIDECSVNHSSLEVFTPSILPIKMDGISVSCELSERFNVGFGEGAFRVHCVAHRNVQGLVTLTEHGGLETTTENATANQTRRHDFQRP